MIDAFWLVPLAFVAIAGNVVVVALMQRATSRLVSAVVSKNANEFTMIEAIDRNQTVRKQRPKPTAEPVFDPDAPSPLGL